MNISKAVFDAEERSILLEIQALNVPGRYKLFPLSYVILSTDIIRGVDALRIRRPKTNFVYSESH